MTKWGKIISHYWPFNDDISIFSCFCVYIYRYGLAFRGFFDLVFYMSATLPKKSLPFFFTN
jgi:hypothetical protein